MSADAGEIGQKHRMHPNSLMNLRPAWEPGKGSPNPGGYPKGTPKVSVAYARLLALPAAELATYEPATVAEAIALKQIRAATEDKTPAFRALPSAIEITDRTEGKAQQRIEHTSGLESERMIIRLQERFLARTGIELSRADAVARLVDLDPTLAGQLHE